MLFLLLATMLLPVVAAFGVNRAIDPLWYGSGNRLFPENFPFNERFSKGNLFLRDPASYDCVVLGSSRTTLLDGDKVSGFSCFNFSVSNGNVSEYETLIEFVSAKTELKLVILGVDAFNFSDHGLGSGLPAFILARNDPPPALESYLSLDVLDFSARAILSRASRTRYYDQEFKGMVMPGRTPFEAAPGIDPEHPYGGLAASKTNTVGPFYPERANGLSRRIRRLVPEARVVGYVPPLAATFVAHIEASGNLDGYLESLWTASRGFDAFYDFSLVSPLTSDPANTYDGSHFYRAANDRVAAVLAGKDRESGIALELRGLDQTGYRQRFERPLRVFVEDRMR